MLTFIVYHLLSGLSIDGLHILIKWFLYNMPLAKWLYLCYNVDNGKGGDFVPRAYTEKRKASNAKWDSANLKRLSCALNLKLYERMKAHTDATGESVNGFISAAVTEKLDRDENK